LENKLITLRLDPKLEQSINTIAEQIGISKSALVSRN
jgi:antitoxin component of RelBE/YafQ-DinJ toxin-antitoxin module